MLVLLLPPGGPVSYQSPDALEVGTLTIEMSLRIPSGTIIKVLEVEYREMKSTKKIKIPYVI